MKNNSTIISIKVWSQLLVILFFISNCTSLSDKEVVAEIGDLSISTYEFKNIVQFNPYLATIKNSDSLKKFILSTIIAEKIFVLEANKNNIYNDKIKNIVSQYRREAIYEKFWQTEIFDQIIITEAELKNAYFKSKEKRVIKYIQFVNEEKVQQFKKRFKDRISFKELNKYWQNQAVVDTIEYVGKLPSIEDSVFNMTKTDTIKIIREGNKYFLVELQNIIRNIFTSEDDYKMSKKKLAKMLKQKKSIQNFKAYKKEHFKPYQYKLDKALFKETVKKMDNYLFGIEFERIEDSDTISTFINKFASDELMKRSIIYFNDNNDWTVRQLLSRLAVSPYPIDFNNRGKFRTSMIAATKHILDNEVVIKYSNEIGLGNTDYVKNETQMWKDYLLFNKMLNYIASKDSIFINNDKSISVEKLDNYLVEKLKDYHYSINYNLLDTLQIIKTDMVALKSHFPLRTTNPIISPIKNLQNLNKILSKN